MVSTHLEWLCQAWFDAPRHSSTTQRNASFAAKGYSNCREWARLSALPASEFDAMFIKPSEERILQRGLDESRHLLFRVILVGFSLRFFCNNHHYAREKPCALPALGMQSPKAQLSPWMKFCTKVPNSWTGVGGIANCNWGMAKNKDCAQQVSLRELATCHC